MQRYRFQQEDLSVLTRALGMLLDICAIKGLSHGCKAPVSKIAVVFAKTWGGGGVVSPQIPPGLR